MGGGRKETRTRNGTGKMVSPERGRETGIEGRKEKGQRGQGKERREYGPTEGGKSSARVRRRERMKDAMISVREEGATIAETEGTAIRGARRGPTGEREKSAR